MSERQAGPLRSRQFRARHVPLIAACLLSMAMLLGDARVAQAESAYLAEPAPANVESLMSFFAKAGAVRARFASTQRISILAAALESEGELYFEPPDRMVRNTTRPGRSKVIVEGTRVAMLDETGLRRMDLSRSGPARGLVENMMLVLRGDLRGLNERYFAAYQVEAGKSREGARWTLSLEPRDPAVAALVAEILFEGRGHRLESMLTREANGDSTQTRFEDVGFGEEISESDRARLFSIEAADLIDSVAGGPLAP